MITDKWHHGKLHNHVKMIILSIHDFEHPSVTSVLLPVQNNKVQTWKSLQWHKPQFTKIWPAVYELLHGSMTSAERCDRQANLVCMRRGELVHSQRSKPWMQLCPMRCQAPRRAMPGVPMPRKGKATDFWNIRWSLGEVRAKPRGMQSWKA
jgi:hypothetical protein